MLVSVREELDDDWAGTYRNVFGHFLGDVPRKSIPLQAEAAHLGMQPKYFKERVVEVASTVHDATYLLLTALFGQVDRMRRAGFKPARVVRGTSFDGTPTQIRLVDLPGGAQQTQPGPGPKSKAQCAKILQSELGLTSVWQREANPREFVFLKTSVPATLQVMDHGTADVLTHCLDEAWRVPGLDSYLAEFKVRAH
eukprot:5711376-Pyramimonas_sp.AAC.1